jgi:hypothetical protein
MSALPQASLFLGIIPALILLYISLKGYEGHYKDKNIFLAFVAGIIAGFITAFAQSFTLPGMIIFIVILAFFAQLLKTIVLNIGRLQEKRATVIYGLSLGLGFGSAFTPFLIIAASSLITTDTYVLLLLGIGSVGLILFHGATGAYIGYGIYTGKLFKYLLIAIILQLPIGWITDMAIVNSTANPQYLQLSVAGSVIYGIVAFWYVAKKIMPQVLTQSKKRKRSKTSR